MWWPVPGKAPRFWVALYSLADKCILKWSNSFWWRVTSKRWLPGETREDAPSTLGVPYTPSDWTPQQKEPHPTLRPIVLLEDKQVSRTPADWAPEEPSSSLAWILHYAQADSDAPGPRLRFLLFFFGPIWIQTAERAWPSHPCIRSGSNRQVQLNSVLSFLPFPHFFWRSWDLGLLGFPETANPYRKVGVKQWELCKSLGPPRGSTQLPHHWRPPVSKKQCSIAWTYPEDNRQSGKELHWKGFGEKSPLLSDTSGTNLQIQTTSNRMATQAQPLALSPPPRASDWVQGEPPPLPCKGPTWGPVLPTGQRTTALPATSGWWGEALTDPAIARQSVLLAAGRALITPQPPQEQEGKMGSQRH